MTKTKAQLTYPVYCHKCRHPHDSVPRNVAMLHGNDDFGGLWHCPKHDDCDYCPHGSYCDEECSQSTRKPVTA